MLSAEPTLTPAAIRGLMRKTAVDAGPEGYDEFYGYGILNLAGCIEALTGGTEVPADGPCTLLPASGPAGALRNNTEEAIACTYALAYYDQTGTFLSLETRQFLLPAGGTLSIPPPVGTGPYGQFVFQSETAVPLAPARKSP